MAVVSVVTSRHWGLSNTAGVGHGLTILTSSQVYSVICRTSLLLSLFILSERCFFCKLPRNVPTHSLAHRDNTQQNETWHECRDKPDIETRSLPTELLQRIGFFATSTSKPSSSAPSPTTSSSTSAVLVERNKPLTTLITSRSSSSSSVCARYGCYARKQVLGHMLHMWLHARWMERFVMPQILQV